MKRWLQGGILLTSILYIFFIPAQPEALKLLFKLIPMWLIISLAVLEYKKAPQKANIFILMGLIFGVIGDGTLRWFIFGLSAFLIGHLFYVISFFQQWTFSKWRLLSLVPIAFYGYFFGAQIISALSNNGKEGLMIPVAAYILVIATMMWFAVMTNQLFIIIGALLFLVSDSLLAWNMFVNDLGGMTFLVMVTYYGAQYFIANSIGRKELSSYKVEM